MRHTLHLRPLLAASTFLVVSGRRKDPLWLHKWLHSRLLALYSYVVRRLGANKPNLVADAEPAAGDAGEAGATSAFPRLQPHAYAPDICKNVDLIIR